MTNDPNPTTSQDEIEVQSSQGFRGEFRQDPSWSAVEVFMLRDVLQSLKVK